MLCKLYVKMKTEFSKTLFQKVLKFPLVCPCRLGYMLNEFWTIEGNEPIAALAEDGCFPSSILVEHSVATWLALVTQRD